jgi:hypothetical protein
LVAIAAIAFGIYYFVFPPPEKVMRKRLKSLAEAISAKPKGNIATVANVNRIGSFFHPNVSINVTGAGADIGSVQGRGELQQAAMTARQRLSAIIVEFYNIEVLVKGKTNATASATALVRLNDDNNANSQQVKFEFEKVGRDWLIRSTTAQNPGIQIQ